jgi:hypothetical protein
MESAVVEAPRVGEADFKAARQVMAAVNSWFGRAPLLWLTDEFLPDAVEQRTFSEPYASFEAWLKGRAATDADIQDSMRVHGQTIDTSDKGLQLFLFALGWGQEYSTDYPFGGTPLASATLLYGLVRLAESLMQDAKDAEAERAEAGGETQSTTPMGVSATCEELLAESLRSMKAATALSGELRDLVVEQRDTMRAVLATLAKAGLAIEKVPSSTLRSPGELAEAPVAAIDAILAVVTSSTQHVQRAAERLESGVEGSAAEHEMARFATIMEELDELMRGALRRDRPESASAAGTPMGAFEEEEDDFDADDMQLMSEMAGVASRLSYIIANVTGDPFARGGGGGGGGFRGGGGGGGGFRGGGGGFRGGSGGFRGGSGFRGGRGGGFRGSGRGGPRGRSAPRGGRGGRGGSGRGTRGSGRGGSGRGSGSGRGGRGSRGSSGGRGGRGGGGRGGRSRSAHASGFRGFGGFGMFFFSMFFFTSFLFFTLWMTEMWFMLYMYGQSASSAQYANQNYVQYNSAFATSASTAALETDSFDQTLDQGPKAQNAYFSIVQEDAQGAPLPDVGGAEKSWSQRRIAQQISRLERENATVVQGGVRVLFNPTTYAFFWARPTDKGRAVLEGRAANEPLPAPIKLPIPSAQEQARMSAEERAKLPPPLGRPSATDTATVRRELGPLRERYAQIRRERHLDIVYDRSARAFIWVIPATATQSVPLPALPAPAAGASEAQREQERQQLEQRYSKVRQERRVSIAYDPVVERFVWTSPEQAQ